MQPIIAVEDLHKSYGDAPALRGVSFHVPPGQLTVIIGPSGCGKSTLLRCLNGLESFDSGRVTVAGTTLDRTAGRPIPDLNARLLALRKNVGMVFQSFNLFPHLTALQNATLCQGVVKKRPKEAAVANATALLQKVGLGERLNHYPGQLSGGQQQRAAIARALAMNPQVMLYDEPTSALDPTLVNEVLTIMRRLNEEGMTQVVVTHEMRFARDVADHVIMLQDGLVAEAGHPRELFTAPRSEAMKRFLGVVGND